MFDLRTVPSMLSDLLQRLGKVGSSRFFWTLIVIELAFLALHLGVAGFTEPQGRTDPANWARIDADQSLSEWFEYALFGIAAALIWLSSHASSSYKVMPIAALLLMLALDNMLGGHEHLAGMLLPGHQAYGELLVAMLYAAAAAGCIIASFVKASDKQRVFVLSIIVGIGLLGGFGVVVDLIHSRIGARLPNARLWAGLIEDFGELVSTGCIAAACWSFFEETTLGAVSPSVFGKLPHQVAN